MEGFNPRKEELAAEIENKLLLLGTVSTANSKAKKDIIIELSELIGELEKEGGNISKHVEKLKTFL